MRDVYHEMVQSSTASPISFSYHTVPGGYHPFHWHEEVEILYPLNGATDITIDNKKYMLPNKQFVVVESCKIHSTYCHTSPCMFLCIHISKKYLQQYFPDIELYEINCNPNEIEDILFTQYLEICKMLETLTRLYIKDVTAFRLEAQGIILQILAHLIRYFSANTAPQLSTSDMLSRERIRQVISYVEEHFREPISLNDISGSLGLGKEYFCRFFKKNMGISFFKYLNEIRLTYVYQDLVNTDLSITEIMERNGFTNQKLFNQSFKKLYGCTPSFVRKSKKRKDDMGVQDSLKTVGGNNGSVNSNRL